jgi:hypothetical protein
MQQNGSEAAQLDEKTDKDNVIKIDFSKKKTPFKNTKK